MVVSIQDSLIPLYLMNIFPPISNKNMFIHINVHKLNPLRPSVPGTFRQNFHFYFGWDHQKISYERRDNESVDEKSLS